MSNSEHDPLAPGPLWQTTGNVPTVQNVPPLSVESTRVAEYFYRCMPEDAQLLNIGRVESIRPWQRFQLCKQQLRSEWEREGWGDDELELWLWHGSDAVDHEVHHGFQISHANMEFNLYGAGHYFSPDPRLAHYFIREARGKPDCTCRLILARVVVGWCTEKAALKVHVADCKRPQSLRCGFWKCRELVQKQLRETQHREAPVGCQSCTSKFRTEVIVYRDEQAIPAYVVEYA